MMIFQEPGIYVWQNKKLLGKYNFMQKLVEVAVVVVSMYKDKRNSLSKEVCRMYGAIYKVHSLQLPISTC
jgi:hypothetical protein